MESLNIDQTDIAGLATAFREHQTEVVISAVSIPGMANQPVMATAAQQAGTVKLFVPSEFMNPTGGHKEGILGVKSAFLCRCAVCFPLSESDC